MSVKLTSLYCGLRIILVYTIQCLLIPNSYFDWRYMTVFRFPYLCVPWLCVPYILFSQPLLHTLLDIHTFMYPVVISAVVFFGILSAIPATDSPQFWVIPISSGQWFWNRIHFGTKNGFFIVIISFTKAIFGSKMNSVPKSLIRWNGYELWIFQATFFSSPHFYVKSPPYEYML